MKLLRGILEFVIYIAVILIVTYLLVHFVAQRTEVIGGSMEPTLLEDDQLIADKISYRFRDPERIEIIVFPYEYKKNTYFIKRVIGLPGETVQIDEAGNIYIDGEILEEHYGKYVIRDPGRVAEPIVLGEDEYFVLGDNRTVSKDSRMPDVGSIHRSRIVGRAWLRIWPFNRFGLLKNEGLHNDEGAGTEG